jgi:MFS family permease
MGTADQEPGPAPLPRFWGRALAHTNYRLFFAGQGVSLIGTWMTRLATGWLAFRLGGSDAPLLLGVIGFAGQAPTFFLAPLAGVLVDRWDRHRTLFVAQAFSLVQSALLAVVAFRGETGDIVIAQVVVLSAAQGIINAFDMPARQVLLIQIVERREDLPNAIAPNSFLVNGARLLGPALAGVLIAAAGEGWCFTIDAVSYLAVIAALLLMRLPRARASAPAGPLWRNLVEGFHYAFGFSPVRSLLLLLALVSFLGMPYTVLMPLFAADVLQGGPATLGFLTASTGVGAVAAALYLASRRTVLGLGRVIAGGAVAFGLGLVGFSVSRSLWLSLPLLFVVGFGMMAQLASSNTILQTITDEDKRGRVMSFYGMAFLGTAPFGSLLAGVLAARIGPAETVLLSGAGCVTGGALFAWKLPRLRPLVRPIYSRLGILPEVAAGMQAAAELTRPPQKL